jgi:hypothetical protein
LTVDSAIVRKVWKKNIIPVIDKLMNTSVIGANMSLAKHPDPVGCSITGRSKDLAWLRLP